MNRPADPLAVAGADGPAAAGTALIEFAGAAKDFTVRGLTFAAVEDVDLSVRQGEFVTLVGPSGCGKSTLLNMTAGLFAPTRGQVSYRGARVQGLNHSVGYMTQVDHLLPWRSIEANIAIPLELRGAPAAEKKDRLAELIALVGLRGFERHYPAQVSGGMKKRCALARLLAYDPETMLMDEPFAALDAQLRLALQRELLAICRRLGKTVLFVTHDLDEAVSLADRCVVFAGRPGRIASVIQVDLPRDRDLLNLRFDARYIALTQQLWSLMAPELARDFRTLP